MKSKTFDWIWNQIDDSITKIEQNLAKEVSHDFHRIPPSLAKRTTKKSYERIRDELKYHIYRKSSKEKKIDHHKIAACICKTLIQNKIFVFNIDDSISPEMLLSNYELAYTASLRIIYVTLIEEYKERGENEYLEKLLNQKTLLVPATSESHDSYHIGRIKTLALNDYYGIEFDLLTYSDMMYWIEYYNRQLIEQKIELSPLPVPN